MNLTFRTREELKRSASDYLDPTVAALIDKVRSSFDPETIILAIGELVEASAVAEMNRAPELDRPPAIIHPPEVTYTILAALEDPDETVRMAVLEAFHVLKDLGALPTLENVARDDPSPDVRDRATMLVDYILVMAEAEQGNE